MYMHKLAGYKALINHFKHLQASCFLMVTSQVEPKSTFYAVLSFVHQISSRVCISVQWSLRLNRGQLATLISHYN